MFVPAILRRTCQSKTYDDNAMLTESIAEFEMFVDRQPKLFPTGASERNEPIIVRESVVRAIDRKANFALE
jgi:hypothetical protein